MNRTLIRIVLGLTLTSFLAAGMPAVSHAGMIGTAGAIEASLAPDRSANLAKIDVQLARADVQAHLKSLGVDPAEVVKRVAALTDDELAGLAKRIDDRPAGGDAELLAVIGIVFIVLLILDYLNVIHVFKR
jgi:hypothetical protein